MNHAAAFHQFTKLIKYNKEEIQLIVLINVRLRQIQILIEVMTEIPIQATCERWHITKNIIFEPNNDSTFNSNNFTKDTDLPHNLDYEPSDGSNSDPST